jgi:hypothetical protein
LEARPTTLLCKQIIVAKSKEVKTGSNLAESSKGGYGSKSAVLPMMVMMMMMMMNEERVRITAPSYRVHKPNSLFWFNYVSTSF